MALSFNKKFYIGATIIATAVVVTSAYYFNSGTFSSVGSKLAQSYTPVVPKENKDAAQHKTNQANNTSKGVPIFSEYYSRVNYEKRKAAAEDLEKFLQHAKFKDDNLAVLNRKLIQIGIEVQKDGSVIVLPDERWKLLYSTLKPSEIVSIRKDMPYIKEGTEDADLYTGKVVRLSPRRAPTIEIKTKSSEVTQNSHSQEEEEEEYYDEELPEPKNAYQDRVNRRETAVKNYLYSTFSKAINHKRHDLRRTVVNSYIDDTFQHYKRKAQEK